ncbi:MAG: HRDC domain-containing protein [Chloroflexi bacterium]|nr:HRDC domain-containing protein [Chloroflexota bacterium]
MVAYDTFLSDIADPDLREETRAKTVGLYRLLDRGNCRHQALCGYFDESITPCGDSCDRCLGLNLDDVAPRRPSRGARGSGATSTRTITPSWQLSASEAEADTFERLRLLRREIADRENVPAYIVFNDAVLREMARRKPKSEQDLRAISGIGPAKIARYGETFLDLLKDA